jgi:NADH-quinone oxidoreductase subunit G
MADAQMPAAASGLVSVTIDGRPVTVTQGTPILVAAQKLGIDVPYFCWHPGLSIAAQCRQCLVEIVGQPRLQPACQVTCTAGMRVVTNSARVLLARQQMLEFTLLNHPVDCPICDKAGECLLQKLYLEWDQQRARIDFPKAHKPKVVDVGPHIVLDDERCILCTRCIRACREVAGQDQLTMALRGSRQFLTTAPGQKLDNPYSLCTVDVCPVGALTAKDFRFAMRAWELQATPSICPGCATGCSVEIHHQRGRIYRLVPRLNALVNKFWMCDAGRFTYREVHRGRLATPQVLRTFAPWQQAVVAATDALKPLLADTPARVGVVISTQVTNEDAFAAARLAQVAGMSRIYAVGRPAGSGDAILINADRNPNTAGVTAITGGKALGLPALENDLRSGALSGLLCFGDPCLAETGVAAARRLKTVVLSAHETPLCRVADVTLPTTLWAEADGTFTNSKGMVQRAQRAIEPAGHARPMWSVVGLVAPRLGHALSWSSARAVFEDLRKTVPGFEAADFGRELPTLQLRFKNSRG